MSVKIGKVEHLQVQLSFYLYNQKKLYQMSRIQGNDYYVNNNYNQTTGTEKIKIVADANGITTKEKMSYHNPMTGVSETYKAKTKGERSRSRSNSSERRRRNIQAQNGYAINSTAPMYTNQPMPLNGIVNQNDVYSRQKGTIKTTEDSYKMKEKVNHVNPITGYEETGKIKHKIVGDRSRSKSNGKSKTTFEKKVDGDKVVIKEKHREGGVMSNIKNKINNLIHRN